MEPLSSSGPQEVPPSPQKFTSTVHFETREVDENGVEVPLDGGHTQVESNESDSETDRGEFRQMNSIAVAILV